MLVLACLELVGMALVVVSCGEYGACPPLWGRVSGKAAGRGCCGLCLVHCWVLRQQDLQRLCCRDPLGFLVFLSLPSVRRLPCVGGVVRGVGVGVVV
jgi:hypothetical protein